MFCSGINIGALEVFRPVCSAQYLIVSSPFCLVFFKFYRASASVDLPWAHVSCHHGWIRSACAIVQQCHSAAIKQYTNHFSLVHSPVSSATAPTHFLALPHELSAIVSAGMAVTTRSKRAAASHTASSTAASGTGMSGGKSRHFLFFPKQGFSVIGAGILAVIVAVIPALCMWMVQPLYEARTGTALHHYASEDKFWHIGADG